MMVAEVRQHPELIRLNTRKKNEFDVSRLSYSPWVGYDDFDLKRVADLLKTDPVLA